MKISRELILIAAASLTLIGVGAGCAKKKVAQTTPAAPQQRAAAVQDTASTPRTTPRSIPSETPAATTSTPAPRYPDTATKARIDQLLARIEDAYFNYNEHSLRPDAIKALQADSTELRDIIGQYPDYKLTIEGHADERGSEAYNLALGDARAKAAKDYLVQVGIHNDQLALVSYGKDKPVCEEHDEACWQKNRRIHIVASPK
jgi:peptidoglycan-associated lipoprotein